jgi:hypothetical protein
LELLYYIIAQLYVKITYAIKLAKRGYLKDTGFGGSIAVININDICIIWGMQWRRYCATNQKVKGSVPDGASGIFH